MLPPIPASWKPILGPLTREPWYRELSAFVDAERAEHEVYPPRDETFAALALTPPDDVRVLILGQDPYHGPGQAHGLAFSVRPDAPIPPSLRNIHRELQADLGAPKPRDGSLVPWAERGVLLLNAVLTVRAGEPNSHRDRGWERFTDAVIAAAGARERRVVFVLWGAYAQRKAALVDASRHAVLQSPHPSPLSAKRGFLGSRPFSRANAALREAGEPEVDWRLPAADAPAPRKRHAR
ncbi:uracil-DNA glycosylase [Roseisolibacter sp. H3M3-2]|uniref:uracil-DNA glycosylase n=1 Tax=Roseisolibacter sp. H3M3-2 TaxID=3031323 RepID=UPI0023DA06B8|nr:uracil-DNA glycosylase [Roseisolibacter sp. H3M3-2]MDF1502471.1 uracil-DNA glycosylase [Roseisolibacter sp. H3M3-2]